VGRARKASDPDDKILSESDCRKLSERFESDRIFSTSVYDDVRSYTVIVLLRIRRERSNKQNAPYFYTTYVYGLRFRSFYSVYGRRARRPYTTSVLYRFCPFTPVYKRVSLTWESSNSYPGDIFHSNRLHLDWICYPVSVGGSL